MTLRVALWVGGVAGSALVHGVGLAILLTTMGPDPVTEQPMPTSEIEVQAYQLDRTVAREQRAVSQPTDTGDTTGAHVAAGAIVQSHASAIDAPVQTLPSARPPASELAQTTTQADKVQAARPDPTELAQVQRSEQISDVKPEPALIAPTVTPTPNKLTAVNRATPALSQIRPITTTMQSAQPAPVLLASVVRAQPALAQVQPVAARVSSTTVSAAIIPAVVQTAVAQRPATNPVAPAPAVAPNAARLPQATPVAQVAPEALPIARKLKAALAFSGDGGGEVDPVSFAAFQSFMQPGDIKLSGDPLRDGVSALLAQVPCSRLQVGFDPDTATLQINGHIPNDDLRGPVLAALQAQMGADIVVSDKILILPRPQCGALSGIADVGLPQSTDQNTNPLVIGQDAHVRVLEFVQNDRLYFDITAPDYDAWVYVDYFDADGNVLHLAPNDQVPLSLSPAESALRIGTKQAGDIGLQLLIGPPYGQEITVAFAASEPLYDGVRPIIEPAAPYLEWLKSRVAKARAQHDDFKGEWVYFFVTTSAN